ncbi:MAG: FAD-dependent oxidoreductase [Oscillospiraceae bacterium]|jgi:2,4-dienoyl-CoA reductase-like NADH-dependent reductase (Old Yellow Enzyme family)/thioredoxin reductase|nr:FAD-dependent oxidoreductase [Oscillospiraceae bacterium]
MEKKFEKLFSPLRVGGVTLKNRIIAAPMTYPVLTADGCLTPEALAFYELRAKGGAAAVTVSELIVDGGTGKYYPVQVLIDAVNAKDSLAAAARAVKRHGAVPSMELSHGGKYALRETSARGVFGPVADDGCEEMTPEVMDELVERYARAAALCRDAGFEMLLIHAGHGWLLQQFLSPATNTRTDEYGGSLENRARLALRVLDRVRAVVGPGFPLELRISAEEYTQGGYTLEDVIGFAKLAESRVDLLQVSTGSHHGCFDKTHPSMFMPRGVNVRYAAEIKKHVKIPVAAIGALADPAMMEEILVSGQADVVEMARALLADPFLPRKAMAGREDEIVRCCRCFTCMAERVATGLRICALNPVIGSEYELGFAPPAAEPKKVLIAGGGPGGMQCAITAAKRGHTVILCEKTDKLGGALNSERGIPFKEDLYRFIGTKTLELAKAGAEVRLNTPVTPELAAQIAPDALVIAVGAVPIIPDLPGIDRAVAANDLPERIGEVGKRVAILGGGLVGCEAAVHLALAGHDVTVVELRAELCPDANARHRPLLLDKLRELPITARTGVRGARVTPEGLVCVNERGEEELLRADTVLLAAGQRPNRADADPLRRAAPFVTELGDCVKPGQVTQAVFRGYFAALDL